MFMVTTEEEIQGPTHLVRENGYRTKIVLNGKETTMEIDTGNGVTLMSKKSFEEIGDDVGSLQKSKLILKVIQEIK